MPSRITIFRIAAVTILLLTGLELVACEVFSPSTCEISGVPGGRNTDSGDACLCCCSHIVVRVPFVFEPSEEVVPLDPPRSIQLYCFESASIYHPPKA